MIDFPAKDKQIFQYYDGAKNRFADPTQINRRLFAACPDFNDALKMSKADCKENPAPEDKRQAAVGEEKVLKAVREAFEMPCNPFAETVEEYGATDDECIEALQAYMDFLKKKETTAAASATTVPPTISGRSPPLQTTKRISDYS